MTPHTENNAKHTEATARSEVDITPRRHRRLMKGLKIFGISMGVLVGILVVLGAAITLYLTPANLTRILNREASEYFKADVKAYNVRFTIWSTFPHFFLEMDSLVIRSRNFDSVSPEIRKALPADADFLASTSRLKGSVNVMKLLGGKVWMKNLIVDDLRLNLVAYNDSINNYDIIPGSGGKDWAIPYFTAGYIVLRHPQPIRYFSAATSTKAVATLSGARLMREKKSLNRYNLQLDGRLTADVKDVRVISRFPFRLSGRTDLKFHPFRVAFSNFAIDLGNTHGKLNMSMNLGEDMKINNLSYHIQAFDLAKFLHFIPGNNYPYISGISTNFEINASARLTAPYSFSATTLPSFEINFNIPRGKLAYTVSSGKRYNLNHAEIDGIFIFNGANPESSRFLLKPFLLSADGIRIKVGANVENLLGKPSVNAQINLLADLTECGKMPEIRPFNLVGDLRSDALVRFNIDKITAPEIRDIEIEGNARVDNFAMNCGSAENRISGKSITLDYEGRAARLSHAALLEGLLKTDARIEKMVFNGSGVSITAKNAHLLAGGESAMVDEKISSRKIPYKAIFNASEVDICDSSDSLSVVLGKVKLTSEIGCIGRFIPGSLLNANLSAASANLHHNKIQSAIRGLNISIDAKRLKENALKPGKPEISYTGADAKQLAAFRHTADVLTMKLPDAACDFINSWDVNLGMKTESGFALLSSFPEKILFSGLNLACSPDSVALRHASLRAGTTAMRISATAGNLRQAFNYNLPAPIPVRIHADLDTVNINALARAYEEGQKRNGTSIPDKIEKPATVSTSDSVALLIPRNLMVDATAKAKETVYTNLHLYDLSTGLKLRDGVAKVDNLKIASDFGSAYLDLSYDTRNINRIGMNMALGVMQIDVVTFFQRFHTLLEMMPQMKNLSGFISAEAKGGMEIFPDMYVNVPSFAADVAVQGRGLQVHQNQFIRRITKMMLIPDDGDLHIKNMDVHARISDNLLELYPFNFEFSNYKLQMVGLNNFAGQLYYHIGVLENPLHLPFGINIVGHYSKPELRFGGASFKEHNAFRITGGVMEQKNVNMVREMKYYLKEFIHKAAGSSDQ